jgi:hypothetical protein
MGNRNTSTIPKIDLITPATQDLASLGPGVNRAYNVVSHRTCNVLLQSDGGDASSAGSTRDCIWCRSTLWTNSWQGELRRATTRATIDTTSRWRRMWWDRFRWAATLWRGWIRARRASFDPNAVRGESRWGPLSPPASTYMPELANSVQIRLLVPLGRTRSSAYA